MSYIENNLSKNEEIIYEGENHWSIFLPAIISGILFLPFPLLLPIPIFFVVYGLIQKRFSEYTITTKRLVMQSGLFSKKITDLMLNKCEGIAVRQSLIGQCLGYGTIVVTTGGATTMYRHIANPIAFRNVLLEQADLFHQASAK